MHLAQADMWAVFGGSGTGKSYLIKSIISRDKRLMVFDPMEEYKGQVVETIPALVALVKKRRFRAIFRPSFECIDEQFAAFCKVAWAVGQLRLVAEELNTVTESSRAPAAWRNVTSRGRHRGLHIIGASQRPAGVDKDFIANATRVVAGRLHYERDWKALAQVFGKDAERLPQLKNRVFLSWDAHK